MPPNHNHTFSHTMTMSNSPIMIYNINTCRTPKMILCMSIIVVIFSEQAMAFTSPSSTKCSNRFTTSYDRRHGIFQPSLSTDGIVDDSEDVFVGTPMKSFSATPITLSIKQPPKEIVNSATLRFNNRLNDMSKNIDAGTASKVETLLLTALAKYEQYTNSTEYKQTNSIPKELVVPNTISFTNAITAWARSTRKDAPYKAEELLNRMHTLYSSGMTHVRPNKISYNSVINAWAKNKNKEYKSGSRAERLLYRLFEFYQEEGGCDEDLCPDARSFNSVINTGEFRHEIPNFVLFSTRVWF